MLQNAGRIPTIFTFTLWKAVCISLRVDSMTDKNEFQFRNRYFEFNKHFKNAIFPMQNKMELKVLQNVRR